MTAEPKHKLTVEEYLTLEKESDIRHEYIDGEVYAMVGASENHLTISMNISVSLGSQMMQRDCRLYANDLRVRLKGTNNYFYPDFAGICGEREFDDQKPAALLNPQLIIEILSSSTEKRDRGVKFLRYQAIKSLQMYLLVSQNDALIEIFVRDQYGFHYSKAEGLAAVVDLPSVGCTMPLAAVYQGITFTQDDDDA